MKAAAYLLGLLLLLSQAAGAAPITITVGDNFYSPQTVTIHPGDVVTWQYQGGTNSHPTASDDGAWTTFTINSANVSNSLTFATAGSFPYHCTFHGGPGVGMYGVITVATALGAQPAQLVAAAFSLYPNPTSGLVTLLVDHSQAREYNVVELFNSMGGLVRTFALRPEEVGQEVAISVADLPAGFYYYRLLTNGQVAGVQRLSLVR